MEKLLAIINSIQKNRGRDTITMLNNDLSLRRDLGFDSLDLAELTVKIETQWDVDIFEDGLITTVGEIVEKIF